MGQVLKFAPPRNPEDIRFAREQSRAMKEASWEKRAPSLEPYWKLFAVGMLWCAVGFTLLLELPR